MKVKKIFIVSLFLLAILTFGAASAADDAAAEDLAVEDAGDVDLEVPAGEEISTDSDTDNVAVGDNVTYEDSSDDVLGASPDEELSAGTVNPTYTYSVDLPKNKNGYGYVEYGQPILASGDFGNATGTVDIKLQNKVVSTLNLVDGKFTFNYTGYTLPANSYLSFVVTYSGDDYYRSVTTPFNYVYIYLDDVAFSEEILYVGQEQYLNVDLHEATGYVNVTLNNVTYREELDNGKFVQKLEGYALGENSVQFEYEGDGKYNPFSKTLTFTYSEKENATVYSSVYKTANKNIVFISIPNARGNNVTITINGKKKVYDLINNEVEIHLDASEVVTDLTVVYDGDSRFNPINKSGFVDLSTGIVTNETFINYFNQENGGRLFDFLDDGITLDFQGSVINQNTSENMFIEINKPVNIISTTGDALIKFNLRPATVNGYAANRFAVTRGGSGSNISGISFYKTQLTIINASHVVLDSINVYLADDIYIGFFTIGTNTTYLTLKNSYIRGENYPGRSVFVLSWADYCTFDNNTFVKSGSSGTFFNYNRVTGLDYKVMNSYNNFTNNKFYGMKNDKLSLSLTGINNLFENNTFTYCGFSSSQTNCTFIENTIDSGTTSLGTNAVAYNNHLLNGGSLSAKIAYDNYGEGTLSVGSVGYNNTVSGIMTVGNGAEAYNNTAGGLSLGANSLVHDNIINGTISLITSNGAQVYNNTFLGDYTISFNGGSNNIFENNDIVGNFEFRTSYSKNNKIVNNRIITSADYAIDLQTYTDTQTNITGNLLNSKKGFGNGAINHVEDATLIIEANTPNTNAQISIVTKNIKVGETAVFNITTNETSIASATVFLDGKNYIVNLSNGKGSFEVENLSFGKYEVVVISNDLTYGAQNTTNLTVDKNMAPRITVDAPVKTQWIDSNITVTIKRATGTVTLDINGTRFNAELVDGAVSFAVPDFVPGTYNFNITYSGDYKYEGAKTNGTLTVVKNKQVIILAEDIIAYGVANEFTAKFTNYIGEAIPNANVTITIGNAAYPKVTDENGTVNVGLMLFRGQYDVTVEFIAIPGEFDAVTAKYAIKVIDGSIMEIVSVDGEGIITGSLTDALGAPIADAKVIAKINRTNTTLTTDNAGLFQFQAQNGYQVVFTFEGDNITTLSEASITLNNVAHVLKEAVIDVSDVNVAAVDTAAGEKGKAYKFTLKDAQGNAIANKTVKVVLNGNVYDVVTDANGTATITISLNAAKTYSLDVFFLGDDDYKGATATAKVTVTKKSTTLKAAKTKYKFKAKAKSKVIKATLKTSNKYLKAGKKVTIKIKGKTYTAKTGKNGAIKINLKSLKKKGTYKAKIKFAGDSTYKASSSKKIKIVIK